MDRLSRIGLFAVVAVIAVASTGCGSGAPTPAADGSMPVTLTEWKVTAPAQGSAGSITFAVSNTGTQIHEFVVVKTDLKAGALAVVDNKIDESVLTPVDEIEDIAVGASPRLTVDLAAGHYVLLCNIESHYEQGMRADFDVK
jgi:uncharacterized cupredoxin-like copper-binding protein